MPIQVQSPIRWLADDLPFELCNLDLFQRIKPPSTPWVTLRDPP